MTDRALSGPGPGGPDAAAARRAERALWVGLGLALALVVSASAARVQATPLLAVGVAGLALAAWWRSLLAWQTLLGLILLVILVIPIRRYTLGGGLPIALEPYRLLVALVLACWFCSLLVDPEARFRRTGLEGPIITFAVGVIGSLVFNLDVLRDATLTEPVLKRVSFFVSFFLILYFIVGVVNDRRQVDLTLRILVGGGAVLGLLALLESRLGWRPFDNLHRLIPVLHLAVDEGLADTRGTGLRARASAQHPIALGALLVLLLPLAVYLYRRSGRYVWIAAAALLALGALSTGSRTAVTMLVALLVTFLWMRREETVRLLPYLLPLAIACQVIMPGTLGTLRVNLNPSYVLQEQSTEAGTGSGRIADLGPALAEWRRTPFFGQGFGTRVTSQEDTSIRSQILDNQWLGALLELGLVGTLALLWLYVRVIRRMTAWARAADDPDDGMLATSLAAALIAFSVGMLSFDAFAFIQVAFMSFAVLGIAVAAERVARETSPPPQRASAGSPAGRPIAAA